MTLYIGDKKIKASYDEWEELFDRLENIFGIEVVEDYGTEKLDQLDAEIFGDLDINDN